jgi:hypothetical protein
VTWAKSDLTRSGCKISALVGHTRILVGHTRILVPARLTQKNTIVCEVGDRIDWRDQSDYFPLAGSMKYAPCEF